MDRRLIDRRTRDQRHRPSYGSHGAVWKFRRWRPFERQPHFDTYGSDEASAMDSLPAPVRPVVASALSALRSAVPGVTSYSVKGGRGPSGASFAELVIDAQDPNLVLQTGSAAVLSAIGATGVSIALPPSPPGQVRMVFSYGTVADPASASAPRRSAREVLDSSPGLFSDELGEDLDILGL